MRAIGKKLCEFNYNNGDFRTACWKKKKKDNERDL